MGGVGVVVGVGVVLSAIAAAVVWTWLDQRRGLRSRVGQWVLVQVGPTAIRGVLTGVYADSLVLAHPAELGAAGALSLGEDEAVIPRAGVLYLQVGDGVMRDAGVKS